MELRSDDYKELKDRFTPLDLLFFKGEGIHSKFIQHVQDKFVGDGTFSHVGILISKDLLPHLDFLEEDKWYVWESTISVPIPYLQTDEIVNVETGEGKIGVQIRNFEDVLKDYTNLSKNKFVAWAPLKDNPWKDPSKRKSIMKTLKQIYDQTKDLHYEKDLFEFSTSILSFGRPLQTKINDVLISKFSHPSFKTHIIKQKDHEKSSSSTHPNDDSYFCSELVAYIYKSLGIIDSNIHAKWAIPMDFLGYDKDHEIPNCTEHQPIKILI